jgi:hypothetical protein
MDVKPNNLANGPNLGMAVVASVVLGAASVIGAGLGKMAMVKIYDWQDKNQKPKNFGFSVK